MGLVRPMRTAIQLTATLGLMGLLGGAEARACKVSHVATAAEITQDADVILLVQVPARKIRQVSPITMTVLAVLKGDFRSKTVIVPGQTARYYGPNDRTVPYDWVRPGGKLGQCFAEDYKPGGQFLLFLRKGEVQWSPLAATNEEVSGPTDPWVIWVKKRVKGTDKV
jgi:hypothetical protein